MLSLTLEVAAKRIGVVANVNRNDCIRQEPLIQPAIYCLSLEVQVSLFSRLPPDTIQLFAPSTMKNIPASILLTALFLYAPNAHAQSSDLEAVLAVTQKIFDAVHSQNQDDWRAIQLPEGTTLSLRSGKEIQNNASNLNLARNKDFVARLVKNESDYLERWTAEPTVMIRGPIAVVWGEYEFWIDGNFSHCGVDSVDLVKLDGEWKMANIMWTVELENCPTDPSR